MGGENKQTNKKHIKVRVRLFVVRAVQQVSVSALGGSGLDELFQVMMRMRIPSQTDRRFYKQSMELSGISPSGGAFPGGHDGGSITLGAGSTFSESSIFSELPSQLMWNRVTRGFEAKMFLWS